MKYTGTDIHTGIAIDIDTLKLYRRRDRGVERWTDRQRERERQRYVEMETSSYGAIDTATDYRYRQRHANNKHKPSSQRTIQG